jgi:hypothetical protein
MEELSRCLWCFETVTCNGRAKPRENGTNRNGKYVCILCVGLCMYVSNLQVRMSLWFFVARSSEHMNTYLTIELCHCISTIIHTDNLGKYRYAVSSVIICRPSRWDLNEDFIWPPLWSSGQSSWLHNGDVLCFLWGTNWIYVCYVEESRPPLWFSGQEFLST